MMLLQNHERRRAVTATTSSSPKKRFNERTSSSFGHIPSSSRINTGFTRTNTVFVVVPTRTILSSIVLVSCCLVLLLVVVAVEGSITITKTTTATNHFHPSSNRKRFLPLKKKQFSSLLSVRGGGAGDFSITVDNNNNTMMSNYNRINQRVGGGVYVHAAQHDDEEEMKEEVYNTSSSMYCDKLCLVDRHLKERNNYFTSKKTKDADAIVVIELEEDYFDDDDENDVDEYEYKTCEQRDDDDNDCKEQSISLRVVLSKRFVGGAQQNDDSNEKKTKKSLLPIIPPEGKAVLSMASAMAIHYLAYSFARPSTIALFTSKSIGFKSPSAFPLAMAFISPTALGLLLVYGKLLDAKGPRMALQQTTLLCSGTLIGFAALIKWLQDDGGPLLFGGKFKLIQLLVGALFIFRESYIQLITSQYWSFMSSVLTPSQSATWFAPISGLTSILSAIAGLCVSNLIEAVGLPGVVASAGICLGCSLFFSETAYDIAEKHGFNPEEEQRKKRAEKEEKKLKTTNSSSQEEGLFHKATVLFQRVPTLGRLFVEILSSQGLSTLLNVCFVTKLSDAIPNDGERAGWTGKFFATINIVSCILQFGVLPNLMKVVEPSWVWRVLPLIMLGLTSIQGLESHPSLYLVAGSLMTMKILEFSARRMLDEMIYVPLDYESRFLGKEVIGVFGYRFGKSGMSLMLSGITSAFGQLNLQQLSQLTIVAALNWFVQAYRLSNLVPTKAQAQTSYEALHQSPSTKKIKDNKR